MANEEKVKMVPKPHSVILDDRKKLSLSGVEDVQSFDETVIVIKTSMGMLIVRGSGLHVGRISLETGDMSVEGQISDLNYEERREEGGLFARLFG